MKNAFLQLLCMAVMLLSMGKIQAQVQVVLKVADEKPKTLVNGSYEFTHSVPSGSNLLSVNGQESKSGHQIRKGNKVHLLYYQDGQAFFDYLTFSESDDDFKLYNQGSPVFSLDSVLFQQIAAPIYSRFKGFSAGAYTVPFRLRGVASSNFDFESSLSLQTNIVAGLGRRLKQRSWIDLSFGIGLTSISLDSTNSKAVENRTASAFTMSTGAVFKATSTVNLGLFCGMDFLGKRDRSVEWIHNGKPWLGLGINITFTEIKAEEPNGKVKKQN